MQLLDCGFGDLPLLDLSAQLPVGVLQLARSRFNAALERAFDPFAVGDVESDAIERNRPAVLEIGLPARRDPALHAVVLSDHPVLDIVDAIASRVGAALDRRLDTRKIVRMDAGAPDVVVDRAHLRAGPTSP